MKYSFVLIFLLEWNAVGVVCEKEEQVTQKNARKSGHRVSFSGTQIINLKRTHIW